MMSDDHDEVRARAAALREAALSLPGVEEGVACPGTALEKRTLKARKKAFLFLGAADAMLKLTGSVGEARALAAEDPDHVKVGAHDWVTVRLAGGPPSSVLARWVAESHAAVTAPRPKRSQG